MISIPLRRSRPYLPLDELLRSCDILTLHVPLLPEDRHMIGRAELAKMKDGVILINTARGGLIDSKALVEALELGRVGACALDVVEDEFQMYYYDRRADVLGNHTLSILPGYAQCYCHAPYGVLHRPVRCRHGPQLPAQL